MVQLWFPGLTFNGAALTRGQLLDVWLFGIELAIPPLDITLVPAITFWEPFLLFDTDWVVTALNDAFTAIPQAVWDFAKGTLDGWAEVFYKEHCTYEEYVKEREQEKQEE